MNKKFFTYAVIPALVLTFTGSVLTASAATDAQRLNPMASFVSAIAQKFNLNVADVQKVVDDQHGLMRASHTQVFAQRLAQAVSDGKLTQAQANLITAKKAELEAFRTSLDGKTQAEKQAAMKTQFDSLKKWATDNKIPSGFAFFGGLELGRGMGKSQGMRHGGMMK